MSENIQQDENYDLDNKLIDVTNALKEDKYQSIGEINLAHRKFGRNPYGQSDMTKSFKELSKNVNLNKKTDIIILTDCRDWKVNVKMVCLKVQRYWERSIRKCIRL